jgi:AP2 domain.
MKIKHGHCKHRWTSPTYQSWDAMIQRCTNPKTRFFSYYGGRGIAVCERWKRFEDFLSDMGNKPNGTTLERINGDLGYEPRNCKWATRAEQRLNQRPRSKAQRNNHSTGILGVYRRGNKFRARITVNHKVIWLGTFSTVEEAEASRAGYVQKMPEVPISK